MQLSQFIMMFEFTLKSGVIQTVSTAITDLDDIEDARVRAEEIVDNWSKLKSLGGNDRREGQNAAWRVDCADVAFIKVYPVEVLPTMSTDGEIDEINQTGHQQNVVS